MIILSLFVVSFILSITSIIMLKNQKSFVQASNRRLSGVSPCANEHKVWIQDCMRFYNQKRIGMIVLPILQIILLVAMLIRMGFIWGYLSKKDKTWIFLGIILVFVIQIMFYASILQMIKKVRQMDDSLKTESLETCIPQDPSWRTCLEEWETLTRKFNRMHPFFIVIFWMSLLSLLVVIVQIIHLNYGDSIIVFFNQWFLHDWKRQVTALFEKYKTKFYNKIPSRQQKYPNIVDPECCICSEDIISPQQVYGMIVETNPDSGPYLCRMPFWHCRHCSTGRMDWVNKQLYEYLKQFVLRGKNNLQTDIEAMTDVLQKENIQFLLADAQCSGQNVRPILKGFVALPFKETQAHREHIQYKQIQLTPLLSKKKQ